MKRFSPSYFLRALLAGLMVWVLTIMGIETPWDPIGRIVLAVFAAFGIWRIGEVLLGKKDDE